MVQRLRKKGVFLGKRVTGAFAAQLDRSPRLRGCDATGNAAADRSAVLALVRGARASRQSGVRAIAEDTRAAQSAEIGVGSRREFSPAGREQSFEPDIRGGGFSFGEQTAAATADPAADRPQERAAELSPYATAQQPAEHPLRAREGVQKHRQRHDFAEVRFPILAVAKLHLPQVAELTILACRRNHRCPLGGQVHSFLPLAGSSPSGRGRRRDRSDRSAAPRIRRSLDTCVGVSTRRMARRHLTSLPPSRPTNIDRCRGAAVQSDGHR